MASKISGLFNKEARKKINKWKKELKGQFSVIIFKPFVSENVQRPGCFSGLQGDRAQGSSLLTRGPKTQEKFSACIH